LENANVAYPDSTSISFARKFKNRNGSLAGNALKRFNIIFDYQKAIVTLKKNALFKERFSYNKSGIELAHNGVRLVKEIDDRISKEKSGMIRSDEPINSTKIVIDTQYKMTLKPAYTIVELRNDSPAKKAGLLIGDVVLRINNKPTHQFSLQDVMHEFYDDTGKHIRLKVDRNGKIMSFNFNLENPF
ncbi:MAG TPA: PDZ domain-containing protein, partial [Mariniflexile sp.]